MLASLFLLEDDKAQSAKHKLLLCFSAAVQRTKHPCLDSCCDTIVDAAMFLAASLKY